MNEIERFTVDTVDAIWQLVRAGRYTQTLVIIYSAIDTLAWASLSSGDVTRHDFCRWVNRYIRPESELGCTADDLYAARCALVHSGSAESRMSREGQATEIWYATSPHSVHLVQTHAQQTKSAAKVLYFTNIVSAFVEAATRFSDEISGDIERLQSVNERIRRWLRFVPASSMQTEGSEKS